MTVAIMRTHLRLLLRNCGFWLVAAGSLILTVIAVRGGSLSRMFMNFNELAAPFFYLGQMLVSTFTAQRERSERVGELVEAMPYRPAAWILGRLLVLYAAWLAVSLVLWATGGALVALAGHPLDLRLLLLNWAGVAPATIAFTTAVGFAIGTLLPRGVVAYFLTVGAWIGGPLLMVVLSRGTNRLPVPVVEYFASGRAFPLSTIGWFPNGSLLLLNRLFVLGSAGVLVSLLVWLGAHRRRLPAVAALAAVALCGAVTAGAVAGAAQVWGARYDAYDAEVASLPGRTAVDVTPLRTDRYNLDVTLDPPDHRIEVTGSFDLTNTGAAAVQAAELTLRHTFRVSAVTGPDGTALPFERNGDLLVVQAPLAPGDTVRLSVTWEGEVWQWRLRDGPKLAAHVAPDSVFLPAHFGWYPVPGRQTPSAYAMECWYGDCVYPLIEWLPPHPGTSFSLQVTGTNLNVVHNAGDDVSGLYLIGTPFETVWHGNVAVTVAPVNAVQGARVAKEVGAMFDFYQSLIPLGGGPLRVIEMPDSSYYGSPWDVRAAAAPGALLVHNMELGRFWDGYFSTVYYEAIPELWWAGRERMSPEDSLRNDLVTYMTTLYPASREHVLRTLAVRRTVVQTLIKLEEAMGRDAAVQVIRELYALRTVGGPTEDDFHEAVRRVAGDGPQAAGPVNRP